MALSKEIYRAFEDILGARNISDDPGVLESYRCVTAQSADHRGPHEGKTPLPQAVIMPGSTEEVQRCVQLCNKYGIDFKASSTFWSVMGHIGSDNAIQVDMRRMKNVEIDARNMYAIVEPYAINAVVQAEAMKHGLNINVSGVGASSSMLAGTAGWGGFGPQSIFMGPAAENMLATEWVLANGEILRTGSLGAGSGWFCGDGPGPSTRAILRGKIGTAGSMGICTRVAVRLHPWPGPKSIPLRGDAPAFKACLPDNFSAYTICFPDWDAYAEGITLLHQSEVLYLGHRQFAMFGRDIKVGMVKILTDPDGQLADLEGHLEDPEVRTATKEMTVDIQVVLAGMTPRDMAYKEKALDAILARVGAWKSEFMADKEIHDWVLMYLLRLGHKNLNFVLCGSYEGNYGLSSNVFVSAPVMESASALKRKWEDETSYIAQVGGDTGMGSITVMGGGGSTGFEFFTHFDGAEPESIRGTQKFFDATQEWMTAHKLGADMGRWNATARRPDGYDFSQAEQDDMHIKFAQPLVAMYQYKVREAFNPKNLCGSYYRTLSTERMEQETLGK